MKVGRDRGLNIKVSCYFIGKTLLLTFHVLINIFDVVLMLLRKTRKGRVCVEGGIGTRHTISSNVLNERCSNIVYFYGFKV